MARDGRNPSIDRSMPIIRLPSADDQVVRDAEKLKRHLNQMEREIETHWHPQNPPTTEDAVSLGLPRITLSGVLDTTTFVPTYTAVGNSLVVRVKIAARTDRYPTPDEVRAMSSDTTSPYTRAFAAIDDGQTSFAAAFGYDSAGNESNLAQAHLTAGTAGDIGGAPVWLFCQRGLGYWQDRGGTVAANDGDPVDRWDDQSGHSRHLLSNRGGGIDGVNWAGGLDYRPILDQNQQALKFGNIVAAGTSGWKELAVPDTTLLPELEVLIGLRAETNAPTGRNGLWQWREGITGDGYPNTNGHIEENFGLGSGLRDIGIPPVDVTAWQAYGVSGSNNSRVFSVRISGTELYSETTVGADGFLWNHTSQTGIGPSIGRTAIGADQFSGYIRDLVIFNGVCSAAQRASWTSYLLGDTDIPPSDTNPSLSYKIIGGDVEITATAPGATSVKIATSLTGNPTDADVRAATALSAPFVVIEPAPESGETMYVGAFAYNGSGTESVRTNLTIPGGITVATSEGDLNIIAGDGVTIDTTSSPGSIIIIATSTPTLVPTLLAAGETFTVPANRQALFKLPITVEGDLIVRGDLLEVN